MSSQRTLFDSTKQELPLKKCCGCGIPKPHCDFYHRNGRPRGKCKPCHVAGGIEWQQSNVVKRTAILKRYNGTAKRKDTSQRYQRPRADQHLINTRARRLKMYGATGEHYDALVLAQNGLCAACGKPETRRHRSGRICALSIDHDHATGKPRDLMCHACNIALGWLKEDPNNIRGLLAYLLKWKPEPT